MKIGFVLECTLDGPEMQICRWLAQQTCPEFTPDNLLFRTMRNKQFLMEGCGDAASNLLDSGCEHVFILWDLRPSWPNGEKSTKLSEMKIVNGMLDAANVPTDQVTCVCIVQELEAWLLVDTKALRDFCGPKNKHISSPGRVEHVDWPKNRVENLLKNRGKTYAAHYDALRIIQKADPRKLRKVPSYKQLEDKLRALC